MARMRLALERCRELGVLNVPGCTVLTITGFITAGGTLRGAHDWTLNSKILNAHSRLSAEDHTFHPEERPSSFKSAAATMAAAYKSCEARLQGYGYLRETSVPDAGLCFSQKIEATAGGNPKLAALNAPSTILFCQGDPPHTAHFTHECASTGFSISGLYACMIVWYSVTERLPPAVAVLNS